MRRSVITRIPSTASVKYFFPIFRWKLCSGCEDEVRLEPMRVVYDDEFTTTFNGAAFRKRKYYCKACAWTHDQAYLKYYIFMSHVRTELCKGPNLKIVK